MWCEKCEKCGVALHVRLPEPDAPAAVAVVVAGTVEQADEFVEAMVDRVVRVLMAAVPLAEKAGVSYLIKTRQAAMGNFLPLSAR